MKPINHRRVLLQRPLAEGAEEGAVALQSLSLLRLPLLMSYRPLKLLLYWSVSPHQCRPE